MVNSSGTYSKANKENDRVKKINLGATYKFEGPDYIVWQNDRLPARKKSYRLE